jgi:uncharacterized membrane protein YhaH (DUF805 family)
MSLSACEYWFSFSVRRNRKSFIVSSLLLYGVLLVYLAGIYFFDVERRTIQLLFFVFGLPWLFVSYNLTAQRLRDFSVTGWLCLLWVPINMLQSDYATISSALHLTVWMVLVFIPGTKGENSYGSDPLNETCEQE